MLFETQEDLGFPQVETCRRRGIVDGLVINDQEVWLVVATAAEDLDEFLDSSDAAGSSSQLVVCREVADGVVVLGGTDPEHDALLSELRDPGVED